MVSCKAAVLASAILRRPIYSQRSLCSNTRSSVPHDSVGLLHNDIFKAVCIAAPHEEFLRYVRYYLDDFVTFFSCVHNSWRFCLRILSIGSEKTITFVLYRP